MNNIGRLVYRKMKVRLSKESDIDAIKKLITAGFGNREHTNALKNIEGRYLLALDEYNNVIAMTGINYSDEYKGYEIDWTTTLPKYRGTGVMHELFKRICDFTDERIYCSCWKVMNRDKVNLHSLMEDFGFKEVISPRVIWDTRYNCYNAAKDCRYKQAGSYCRCQEDLYIRESKY